MGHRHRSPAVCRAAGVAVLGTIYCAIAATHGYQHAMAWSLPIDLTLLATADEVATKATEV